jgi:hypothetical protein
MRRGRVRLQLSKSSDVQPRQPKQSYRRKAQSHAVSPLAAVYRGKPEESMNLRSVRIAFIAGENRQKWFPALA